MIEAGVYICLPCRDDSGDDCSDYCGMNHVEELPPIWLDYWPECRCCKAPMHLLEVLAAVST